MWLLVSVAPSSSPELPPEGPPDWPLAWPFALGTSLPCEPRRTLWMAFFCPRSQTRWMKPIKKSLKMKGNLFDIQGKSIWNDITCIFTTLQKPNYNFEWLKKVFKSLKIIQNGIKKKSAVVLLKSSHSSDSRSSIVSVIGLPGFIQKKCSPGCSCGSPRMCMQMSWVVCTNPLLPVQSWYSPWNRDSTLLCMDAAGAGRGGGVQGRTP